MAAVDATVETAMSVLKAVMQPQEETPFTPGFHFVLTVIIMEENLLSCL